jgi:hypothetical protein
MAKRCEAISAVASRHGKVGSAVSYQTQPHGRTCGDLAAVLRISLMTMIMSTHAAANRDTTPCNWDLAS